MYSVTIRGIVMCHRHLSRGRPQGRGGGVQVSGWEIPRPHELSRMVGSCEGGKSNHREEIYGCYWARMVVYVTILEVDIDVLMAST